MMTRADQITEHLADLDANDDIQQALAPGEIVLGTLVGLDAQGRPLVSYPQCKGTDSRPAITTLTLSRADVGRQTALLFANGDLNQPIILGLIYSPLYQLLDNYMTSDQSAVLSADDQDIFDEVSLLPPKEPDSKSMVGDSVRVDGKRVIIEGEKEVVLVCGESSITLQENGKIVIRGKYLLSRASGVNRILGGSVEVN
jgi:hypothetical protein